MRTMSYLGVDVIVSQTEKTMIWTNDDERYFGRVISENNYTSQYFGPRDTQAEIEWLMRTWQRAQKSMNAQTENYLTILLDRMLAFPLFKRILHFS